MTATLSTLLFKHICYFQKDRQTIGQLGGQAQIDILEKEKFIPASCCLSLFKKQCFKHYSFHSHKDKTTDWFFKASRESRLITQTARAELEEKPQLWGELQQNCNRTTACSQRQIRPGAEGCDTSRGQRRALFSSCQKSGLIFLISGRRWAPLICNFAIQFVVLDDSFVYN